MDYQGKAYKKLNKRLVKYSLGIEKLLHDYVTEATIIAKETGFESDGVNTFSFADFSQTSKRISDLDIFLSTELKKSIQSSIDIEWQKGTKLNELLQFLSKHYGIPLDSERLQGNSLIEKLNEFKSRIIGGNQTLPQKVINSVAEYKQEVQEALSYGLEAGHSADVIAHRIINDISDFDKFSAAYKEMFGTTPSSHNMMYQVRRLARNEINMAYRSAESERWRAMDFVVGKEIKSSGTHPVYDICDVLQGKYPKDFVFLGWHPNCRCYAIPILKTEDEFFAFDAEENLTAMSINEVTELPDNFKEWIKDNADKIARAERKGTEPYFIRGNDNLIKNTWVLSYYQKIYNIALDELSRSKIGFRTNLSKDIRDLISDARTVMTTDHSAFMEKMGILERKLKTVSSANKRQSKRDFRKPRYKKLRNWYDKRIGLSKEEIDNYAQVEKAIGVARGLPMTHKQADIANANPAYSPGSHHFMNCQTCVPAYELRRRGFDVVANDRLVESLTTNKLLSSAKICTTTDNNALALDSYRFWLSNGTECTRYKYDFWQLYEGIVKVSKSERCSSSILRKSNNLESFKNSLEKQMGTKGRYQLCIEWWHGGAHTFCAERLDDGSLIIFCPQSAKNYSLDGLHTETKSGTSIKILRVDNKLINTSGEMEIVGVKRKLNLKTMFSAKSH